MKILTKILVLAILSVSLYAMPPQTKEQAKDVVKTHSGIAGEIIVSGGYSYINIDEKDEKFWIAVAGGEFKKGDKVTFIEEMWMPNFKSKTLDKTFDKILFASVVNSAPASVSSPKMESIAKVKDGYTVAELFSKKDTLKDKTVKIRGKVVKVSENIMGKSWIHIQDGTGDVKTKDIIFTSKTDIAKIGDIVVATGKLVTDQDLGYGYFYPILVEGSTFSK